MATGTRRVTYRRPFMVGLVAAAVVVPTVLVAWAPWAGGLPEVTRGKTRCPAPSTVPPPDGFGAGPLVPDVRYHLVQLCPPGSVEWTSFRVLSEQTSAEMVERLNGLATQPPSPRCATTTGQEQVDLVLRADGVETVVRLDTGPCGAGDLYRYVAELLAE